MPASARILIIFVHPVRQKSHLNVKLADAAQTIEEVTFHDLYEAYPDFYINVEAEQKLLSEHDIIVFQHPSYWYSCPSLLKEWLDVVLQRGWAYGDGEHQLQGKYWLTATTTGGPESSYTREGRNRFSIREFLAPFEQTAHLCGMVYLPPFVVYGAAHNNETDIDRHASAYRQILQALVERKIDPDQIADWPSINANMDALNLPS